MRNLMALLMTCGPDEVSRIAGWWGVELPRARESERAAVLGREMLRDASARRYWEALSEEAQALFFRFAHEPEARLSALELDRDAAELHTLLESGAVWAFEGSEREGGVPSLALPPVADPTLVMPPELCRLANRLLGEIEAGDTSGLPLDESLERLGAGELENLAAYWGLAAEPGSYTRDELLESLLGRISGTSTDRVVTEAPEPARKLYEALVGAGGCAPTLELGNALGLDRPGLRDAVADLGERLLALECFSGAWLLYAPLGPEHALPGDRPVHKAPDPVTPPERHVPPPHWAPAWDLINVLRALDLYDVPVSRNGELPDAFVSRFESALLTRPANPAANLRLLHRAARAIGLVTETEGSAKTTPRARKWAETALHAQARRLLDYWIERGHPDGEKPITGAPGYRHDPVTLKAARTALLEYLAACEPGRWYTVEGFVSVLHSEQPYLLRPQNRLVRDLGSTGARQALEDWQVREGQWVQDALCGPLAWLHVIEGTHEPAPGYCLTPDGAWLAGRVPRPPTPPGRPSRLSVSEEGRVRVSAPDGRLLWELAGFARPSRAAGRPLYLIDRRSIARARSAGFGPQTVVALLRRHAENSVPPRLVKLISEWGREPHRIKTRPALLITCETDAGAEELLASPITRPHHPRRLDGTTVLLSLPSDNVDGEMQTLLRRLTRSGLFSS